MYQYWIAREKKNDTTNAHLTCKLSDLFKTFNGYRLSLMLEKQNELFHFFHVKIVCN